MNEAIHVTEVKTRLHTTSKQKRRTLLCALLKKTLQITYLLQHDTHCGHLLM